MITVNNHIKVNEKEIKLEFVRASGPGGQNVNKVSTAVQLRFNVEESESLPEYVKNKLYKIAGNRINNEGELIIDARTERSQDKNRQEAIKRLTAILREAVRKPKKRKATKPSRAAKEKRLENKKKQSDKKKDRKSDFRKYL